jgi:hypothetical protein
VDDDTRLLRYFARRGIFLPIFVCLWFLVRLWREGELFGRAGTLFCVWFVLATVAQLFAPSIGLSVVGLLAQVALAIVLVLKQQLSDIMRARETQAKRDPTGASNWSTRPPFSPFGGWVCSRFATEGRTLWNVVLGPNGPSRCTWCRTAVLSIMSA